MCRYGSKSLAGEAHEEKKTYSKTLNATEHVVESSLLI
jgi:hypothetical protein